MNYLHFITVSVLLIILSGYTVYSKTCFYLQCSITDPSTRWDIQDLVENNPGETATQIVNSYKWSITNTFVLIRKHPLESSKRVLITCSVGKDRVHICSQLVHEDDNGKLVFETPDGCVLRFTRCSEESTESFSTKSSTTVETSTESSTTGMSARRPEENVSSADQTLANFIKGIGLFMLIIVIVLVLAVVGLIIWKLKMCCFKQSIENSGVTLIRYNGIKTDDQFDGRRNANMSCVNADTGNVNFSTNLKENADDNGATDRDEGRAANNDNAQRIDTDIGLIMRTCSNRSDTKKDKQGVARKNNRSIVTVTGIAVSGKQPVVPHGSEAAPLVELRSDPDDLVSSAIDQNTDDDHLELADSGSSVTSDADEVI